MIRERFRAMGTTIEAIVAQPSAGAAVRDLFAGFEDRFSRFLPDSELSAINRDSSARVEVSPLMAEVLRTAADLRERTGGLVDPAVGAGVRAWGYDRTFDDVVDLESEPADVPATPEWGIAGREVSRAPGTRLDLGGIVKGWAADRVVESGMALLVSAGGDVRSALAGAVVEVVDPAGGAPIGVQLGEGALATSSVARRRWKVDGREVHHLIDPRTGTPASTPVVSASVRCGTAIEAEAAAKAVVLSGTDGLAWADGRDWVESVLVAWNDGSIYATRGWEYAA